MDSKLTPIGLDRRLTPFSAALFGISYICPTVVLSTFGVLSADTHGAPATAYAIATVAMLFTAMSYARMAARYPQAGSAYTYVSRTASPYAGFLTGWVLILDYLFMPMVISLFTAKAIEVIVPGISYRFWILLIALLTTGANVLGIKVADRINLGIMAGQLAVIVTLVVLCTVSLQSMHAPAVVWSAAPFVNARTSLPALMSGAAIAAYSFLGFDAVTTLSEETREPTKSIPRATVCAALASGIIYVGCAYLMALVHPSTEFSDVDNAGYAILGQVSGRAFPLLFTVVLVAFIAASMCAQAGSSRLLYAMGRDGVLPRAFAGLHPRLRTPVFNIAATGAVMLVGLGLDVETAASCVNFGAFAAFMVVNSCVVVDHLSGRRALPGGVLKVCFAAAGAIGALWLALSLHRLALLLGGAWFALGVIFFFVRSRVMRIAPARSIS